MKNAHELYKFESSCFVIFSTYTGAGFFLLLLYKYGLSLSIVVTSQNINIVSEVPAERFRRLPWKGHTC